MDGFININKPKNFTSHDVLNVLKRSFRGTKIGHAGTLDPAAIILPDIPASYSDFGQSLLYAGSAINKE